MKSVAALGALPGVRARMVVFASLVVAVTTLVGVAFLIAVAYHLTGADWRRAILIVFLIGGAGLVALRC